MRTLPLLLAAAALVPGQQVNATAGRDLFNLAMPQCAHGGFPPGDDWFPCGIPCAMAGLQTDGQARAALTSAIYPLSPEGYVTPPTYLAECTVQLGSANYGSGTEVARIDASGQTVVVAADVVTFSASMRDRVYVCTTWSWSSPSGNGTWQVDADANSANGAQCALAAEGIG